MRKFSYILFVLLILLSFSTKAQNVNTVDEVTTSDDGFHFTTTFVSNTLWRGGNPTGAAVLPEMSFSAGGFTIGSFAVNSFKGEAFNRYSELDFYAQYSIAGFSVIVTDYCWNNDLGNNDFEYFGKYDENHYFEAGLAYDFGEQFDNLPLTFGVNTMFAGRNKDLEGDQAFSTYLELSYAPSLSNGLNLAFTLGAAIEKEEAAMYSKRGGFNLVNTDLGLSYDFNLKGKATLTLGGDLIANPAGFGDHGEFYALGSVGISF